MRLIPLALFVALAIFGPLLAPHPPDAIFTDHVLEGPSAVFPLGTDYLGRCLGSRLLFGARSSFLITVVVVALSGAFGVCLGVLAGWFGGWIAAAVSFVTDWALAFPALILGLATASVLGPGLPALVTALIASSWMRFCRVVEGLVRATRRQPYVESAMVSGAGPVYILRHHLVPELTAPVFVLATFGAAGVMLHAAALSFIGLGVMPPEAEWGAMLCGGRSYLGVAPRLTIAPGLAIWLTLLSFHMAADDLRRRFPGSLPGGWEGI